MVALTESQSGVVVEISFLARGQVGFGSYYGLFGKRFKKNSVAEGVLPDGKI